MINLKSDSIKIAPVNQRLAPRAITKNEKTFAIEYTTAAWKTCKKELGELFSTQYTEDQKAELDQENISVEITIVTYKDIDSIQKIIFDAMEEIGLIENDRYIKHVTVIKLACKRGQVENLKIRIW